MENNCSRTILKVEQRTKKFPTDFWIADLIFNWDLEFKQWQYSFWCRSCNCLRRQTTEIACTRFEGKKRTFKANCSNSNTFLKFTGFAKHIRIRILHRSRPRSQSWKYAIKNPVTKSYSWFSFKMVIKQFFSTFEQSYADRVDICNSAFIINVYAKFPFLKTHPEACFNREHFVAWICMFCLFVLTLGCLRSSPTAFPRRKYATARRNWTAFHRLRISLSVLCWWVWRGYWACSQSSPTWPYSPSAGTNYCTLSRLYQHFNLPYRICRNKRPGRLILEAIKNSKTHQKPSVLSIPPFEKSLFSMGVYVGVGVHFDKYDSFTEKKHTGCFTSRPSGIWIDPWGKEFTTWSSVTLESCLCLSSTYRVSFFFRGILFWISSKFRKFLKKCFFGIDGKKPDSIFIKNPIRFFLAVSDLLTGIYLLGICYHNELFKGQYTKFAIEWLHSAKCKALGIIGKVTVT